MSQETKFTPEPWRVYYNGSYGPFVVTEKTNDPDYGTADHANGHETHAIAAPGGPNARANARLIAASPTLLDACQKAQNLFDLIANEIGAMTDGTELDTREVRQALQDAIAKATGESA